MRLERRNSISSVVIAVVIIAIIVIAGVAYYFVTSSSASSSSSTFATTTQTTAFTTSTTPTSTTTATTISQTTASSTTTQTTAQAPSQINVGAVLALTGIFAAAGQDEKIGLDFWVAHVNQNGGIYMSGYGKKILVNVIVLDDRSDVSQDPTLMQQLITQYNVVAILSGSTFPNVITQIPIAERNHVPYISQFNFYNSTWNFFSGIDPKPQYVYWVWPSFLEFPALFWQWWDTLPADQRPTKVAALTPNVPGFDIVASNFLAGARTRGVTVVLPLQTYDITSTDLSPLILKLKDASPDVVFSMSLPSDGILFFKQAVQLNFQAKMFLFPPVVEYNQLNDVLGPNVNGLVSATTWNKLETVNASQALAAYYKNQTKMPATPITACYTAVTQVMFNAIQTAGVADRDAIAQALLNTNVETTLGRVQFDPNTHISTTVHAIMIQWQNGVQQIVLPNSLATSTVVYPMPPWSKP